MTIEWSTRAGAMPYERVIMATDGERAIERAVDMIWLETVRDPIAYLWGLISLIAEGFNPRPAPSQVLETYLGRRVIVSSHLPVKRIWTRPGRVPSKAAGRRGTRRSWKRSHRPGLVDRPDLPRDAVMTRDAMIVDRPTYERLKAQAAALDRSLERRARDFGQFAGIMNALGAAAEQGGYKVAGFASAMSSLRDYNHSQLISPLIDRVLAPLRGQT